MRNFSARETEWLLELDGIELASFWQRALALLIDLLIVMVVFSAITTIVSAGVFSYLHRQGKDAEHVAQSLASSVGGQVSVVEHNGVKVNVYKLDEHSMTAKVIEVFNEIVVPILYFGILLWWGKGRTPGKRILRIRVVSIVHRHLSFWHSVERALGYGAAALEGGFGFIQFFIHPYRRCAQDRLAETMVVTERGYQVMQSKRDHPLLPDTEVNRDAPE